MKKYSAEDCYITWVAMGDDRSIARLSDVTGKSEGTLRNYSSKFKWSDRLKETKEQDKMLIESFISDNSVATRLLESEVYKGVSERLLQYIRDSVALMQPSGNPRDLKTALDSYRLINGQPTDISRQETATVTEAKAQALADEELFSIPDEVLFKLLN